MSPDPGTTGRRRRRPFNFPNHKASYWLTPGRSSRVRYFGPARNRQGFVLASVSVRLPIREGPAGQRLARRFPCDRREPSLVLPRSTEARRPAFTGPVGVPTLCLRRHQYRPPGARLPWGLDDAPPFTLSPASGKLSTPYALQASLWPARKQQDSYWLQAPFSLPLEERDET